MGRGKGGCWVLGETFVRADEEEGRDSIAYVMRTTGAAVLMASVTTMVGFSGMVMARHQGLNSMGDVAIIGMIACLVMSVIFMPALLTWLEKRIGHPVEDGVGPKAREHGG